MTYVDNAAEARRPHLSVVIPAYNEEKRLPHTLEQLDRFVAAQLDEVEVIIVDDGSTDATSLLLAASQRQRPWLRVVGNPHSGKSYSIRTGIAQACGLYCLQADADFSVSPAEFDLLLQPLEQGSHVAIGSRAGRPGAPWYRQVMSQCWHILTAVVVVSGFKDTQCGFKAYNTEVIQHILRHALLYNQPAASLTRARVTAASDVEVLFLANKLGYVVMEVPVTWNYAQDTKIQPLMDSLLGMVDLLKIRWYYLRGYYQLRPSYGIKTWTESGGA